MKKLTCLFLVLVLVCGSVGALAAGSKSTGNMTTTKTTGTGGGGTYDAPPAYSIDVGSDAALTDAQKQLVEDVLAQIAGAANPLAYFGDEVKAEIEALLPGVDVDALQLNELTGITVKGYSVSNGSLTINCVFPTKYTVGQKVVVLVGLQENGTITWKSFAGIVLADGSVSAVLSADVLMSIQNGTAIIAVLND